VTARFRFPLPAEIVVLILLEWIVSLVVLQWSRRSVLPATYLSILALAPLIYLPLGTLLLRGEPLAVYGVTLDRTWRALGLTLLAAALVFPPYAVASYVSRQGILVLDGAALRHSFAWVHWLRQTPHAGSWLLTTLFWQLCFVAVSEEFFYRGYLQGRLNLVLGSRRQVLGAPIEPSVPICAAVFALHHLIVDFAPQRLLVFFPALVFGWLRQVTGSLLAPTLFHAACNVFATLVTRAPSA